MTDLIERYIHQVGRYLPRGERAEIEAELRSLIQDKLDDRYTGAPSPEAVASVLAELGYPHQMAASYGGGQYLIGPELYPSLMIVLRHGWLVVPAAVLFLNAFGALISAQPRPLLAWLLETVFGIGQAVFIFSAVVVLIFVVIQRSGVALSPEKPFDPSTLPEVDDPRLVERFEATFGIAFGTFITLLLLYFLSVGGLTLRFPLSDPSDVLPVPRLWLALLILVSAAIIILYVVVLRRNRWSVALWLLDTVLETFGVICMYFVLYKPLLEPILAALPWLANVPFIHNSPEIIAVLTALSTLTVKGSKLIGLWRASSNPPSFTPTEKN
ncbi:MAG: hypothetical protein DYG88_04290 [Chloroflexi bacterium CFX4]|nr:hypothetical protein [Chloroflexi bacterium CFX4]MDL1921011.1 hypothetical protein [Chloroflexi bacterium CFX3]